MNECIEMYQLIDVHIAKGIIIYYIENKNILHATCLGCNNFQFIIL